MIFEYYLIVLLPNEFFEINFVTKRRLSLINRFVRLSKLNIFVISLYVSKCLIVTLFRFLIYLGFLHPYQMYPVWFILMHLILSSDVHKNPGPIHHMDSFCGGCFTVCNWNLNILSKDNFHRVSLLQVRNVNYNCDIISLCLTSP